MVIQLTWIAIIYGLAIAIVHGLYATTHKLKGNRRNKHKQEYILVTCNHERKIEWYVRALWLYALLKGKKLYIHVIDHDSNDETVQMIDIMREWSGLDLSISVGDGVNGEHTNGYLLPESIDGSIWIDVRTPQEDRRIPYVQR